MAQRLLRSRHRELSSASSATFQRGLEQFDAGKLADAVSTFAEAASDGDADGNFYLGLAYDGLLGRDAADELPIEVDAHAAARCYKRAAEAGHREAMLNLSMCYRTGEGMDNVDVAAAFEWLTLSAAAGCDRAQFNAGVALDPLHPPYGSAADSTMIPKDAKRAVGYYREAAEQGHAKGMTNLGVGSSASNLSLRSRASCSRVAISSCCCSRLGQIALYTGTGCEKDAAAAKTLWLEAVEMGNEQAQFCLNNMEETPGKLEKMFDD